MCRLRPRGFPWTTFRPFTGTTNLTRPDGCNFPFLPKVWTVKCPTIHAAVRNKKPAVVSVSHRRRVMSFYFRDKAARLFNSLVAMYLLVITQNAMAWHFQGVVWNDSNQDGIHQSGETGVSNVTVKVLNCSNNAVVFTTTTASDGSFTVTDSQIPLYGNYEIAFTNIPSGYTFSKQTYPPPTNGTLVSTVDPTTGIAPCFIFNQPADVTLNNAGLIYGTATTATPLTPLVECPGSSATFSTVASGTGPFTYVWRLGGLLLSSQTTSSLTIPSVSSTNAGAYSVVVSGKLNSVTNSASLTVSTNTSATSLTSLTLCPGSPATFDAAASGTGPFTYVWRLNGAQLSSQTAHTPLALLGDIGQCRYAVWKCMGIATASPIPPPWPSAPLSPPRL